MSFKTNNRLTTMHHFFTLFKNYNEPSIKQRIFLYCHEEKLKYRVLLPSSEVLHISPETNFYLMNYGKVFANDTRSAMNEKHLNTINFSKLEYDDLDIIAFFYILGNVDEIKNINNSGNVMMLAHLYTPDIVDILLYNVTKYNTIKYDTDKHIVENVWKCTIIGYMTKYNSKFMYEDLKRLLRYFPHTLYEFDCSIDIVDMIEIFESQDPNLVRNTDTKRVLDKWSRKDSGSLYDLQYKHLDSLIETNKEGLELLLVSTVVSSLGLILGTYDLRVCEYYVKLQGEKKACYSENKIHHIIDGKLTRIIHYTIDDYDDIIEGIDKFVYAINSREKEIVKS